MALGRRLAQARQRARLTQVALGKISGVPQATICALEKRDSRFSRYSAELADAMGLREHWLKYGEGPVYQGSRESELADAPISAGGAAAAATTESSPPIDAAIIADILEAIEAERDRLGDRPLTSGEMAQLIADTYNDVTRTMREQQRARVRAVVSRGVSSSEEQP